MYVINMMAIYEANIYLVDYYIIRLITFLDIVIWQIEARNGTYMVSTVISI